MNYHEEALVFACLEESLLGVLSVPEEPAQTGVVIIVGGPQYRAGSHRQFVLLARALAKAGHAVLRFDYRGMGDSSGDARDFLDVSEDIGAAIDALQQRLPSVLQIALCGLCDGASAALLYCQKKSDVRVTGLCLSNPWVRSDASLARTQVKHYYAQRLMQREFWSKLITGKVAVDAFSGLLRNVQAATKRSKIPEQTVTFQQQMAHAWVQFQGSILLLLSEDDYTAKEFLEYTQTEIAWRGALRHGRLTRHDLANADHTFSGNAERILAEISIRNWLNTQFDVSPCRPTLAHAS